MVDAEKHEKRARLENRVLSGTALALLLWVAGNQIKQAEDIGSIKDHSANTDIAVAGTYTARDAKRDFSELSANIASGRSRDEVHDQRLDKLEHGEKVLTQRVDAIERKVRNRPE